MNRRAVPLLLATAMLVLASPALAQTREEIERRPVEQLPPATPQRLSVDDQIERAPCPLAAPEFADVKFTFRRAEFSGTDKLPAGSLDSTWQDYVGQTLPVGAICDIRDRAATALRARGYLAAVRVPPQTVEDGSVRLDVLLGRVVGFQVRGDAGRGEKIITRYLEAIREQPVFNIVEAERYLLLARDLPGYDVRLTLRPAGQAPGEVIGEVQVVHVPVEAQLNTQNFGSHATGRWGGLAQLALNGMLIPGDQTRFGYFATADFKEQHVLQFAEQVPVGREGMTITGSVIHAWTRPSAAPGLDLRSRTLVAGLEARYPLIRRQTHNLSLLGGFEVIDQKTRLASVPLTEDKLRIAFMRLDFGAFDPRSLSSTVGYSPNEPRWRVAASLEARQGFSGLGASKGCGATLALCALPGVVPPSHLEGRADSFVLRASASAEVRPVPAIGLRASARGQYAARPLLSYEEFSAGSFTAGRGYDPGIIAGDRGLGLTGEINYGQLTPANNRDLAWQVYAFADAAWVRNEDRIKLAGLRERLYSAGGGLRLAFGDRFALDTALAVPLNRTGSQTRRGDVRLLINLTTRLLPLRRN